MVVMMALYGLAMGLVIYVGAAYTVDMLPAHVRERMAQHYWTTSMWAIGRSMLVARKTGEIQLVKTSFDAEFGAERVSLDGETMFIRDDQNNMGRLEKSVFGLAVEEYASTVDPVICEAAAADNAAVMDGKQSAVGIPEGSDEPERMFSRSVPVTDGPAAVSLTDIKHFMAESTRPWNADTAREYAQISQEQFHEKVTKGQAMMFIMSAGGGFGITVVGKRFADSGGGGGGTTNPLPVGMIDVAAHTMELVGVIA